MGTQEDYEIRSGQPRLNDDENREMIRRALACVENGYAVTGNVVLDHLQERSMHPVEVSCSRTLS